MYTVFAQLTILAQEGEGAEGSGGVGLLLPAVEELVAGAIAFAIVFFFVWKWGVPALNTILEARQAEIQGRFDAAEQAKQEAESLLADYREQVAGARNEASVIVDDAREAAEAVRADIVARAETEAQALTTRSADEIAAERDRVAADLQRQVADLSLDVAEKVVASSLDRDGQRALVDRYIDELGGVR